MTFATRTSGLDPRSRRRAWAAALLLACCGLASPSKAQVGGGLPVPEQSVKAAYLYKFANYVEWPGRALPEPGSPITIGVLGAAELAEELAAITAERTIGSRPIRVRRVAAEDALEEAFDDLHILFVGDREAGRLGRLLAPARVRPILTVTESDGALARGSIINFTVVGGRVRFEISLRAAAQSELRLNARLLAVAERVEPNRVE